ncbi:HK97 gp10 family phage protein [Robertmurraya sp. FSL W8-0741]|uniref:HK97 gp10 family phage protein n=1 Tax=Robertmurraya sp. FSL W8-0741 TaxID=2954629 RepID=UPI0030FAB2C6
MTSIDQLTNEIMKQLRAYESDVKLEIEEAGKDVSKSLVSRLKTNSPKLKGDYRKGWRVKREKNKFIVYNATDYQLTHLLENGHALRQGGRAPAIPHIRPAEEEAIEEYLSKIERALET